MSGEPRRTFRSLRGSLKLFTGIQAVTSVGFGLYIPTSALYFTQSVGLPATSVGLGLAVAGLVSLPLGVPIGRLADRWGAREVTIGLMVCQAGLLAAATQIQSLAPFLILIVILGTVETGVATAAGAAFAGAVPQDDRVWLSAINRTVFNVGFTAGLLAAGIAVGLNTRAAYVALLLGNALATAAAAALYLKVPRAPRTRGPEPDAIESGRFDTPYFLVGLTSGLVSLGENILVLGLPLWLVSHTAAPRAAVIWIIALNTLIVVVFQVRAARLADTITGAGRLQRRALAALVLACVAIWALPRDHGWAVVAGAVVVVVLVTLAELWGESARWALRFGLAPEDAQGRYGGIFGLGMVFPIVGGPLLLTAVPDTLGAAGWLVVGLLFVGGLVACQPALNLAVRTRPTAMSDESSELTHG